MKSIKLFILMLGLGISMVGCETFLDPNPDNQNPYSRVLTDAAFAEGILINAYTRLPGQSTTNPWDFPDVATDDAVSNDPSNIYRRAATGELSSLFNPMDRWTTAYAAIYNINYFLTQIDKVDWSWQNEQRHQLHARRLKGEAFALRALFYQMLLADYGGKGTDGNLLGVPLVLADLGVNDDWSIPRATYQQTLDQINKDYDSALNYLPYRYVDVAGQVEYTRAFGAKFFGRIDAKIIKALRCRLNLTAASPAFNNGVYDEVRCAETAALVYELLDSIPATYAVTAPLVANTPPANLPSDGVEFYNTDGDATNPEIFWRRDYFTTFTTEQQSFPPSSFGSGRVNPSQNFVDAFPGLNGYPITDTLSLYNANNPYSGRDPRFRKFVLAHGENFKGVVYNASPDNPTNDDGLNKLAGYSTRTGYYLKKLMRVDASANPNSTAARRHFWIFIRYTELFLIYAEAANEAWGPDADGGQGLTARAVIQRIRQRAGITQPDAYLATIGTKEAMRELIRNERRIELSFEGFRFWDMRRWGLPLEETVKGITVDAAGTTFTPMDVEIRKYDTPYMPIPFTEVIKYGGLIQNQGW